MFNMCKIHHQIAYGSSLSTNSPKKDKVKRQFAYSFPGCNFQFKMIFLFFYLQLQIKNNEFMRNFFWFKLKMMLKSGFACFSQGGTYQNQGFYYLIND
jgi:hypothetical protein